MTPSPTPLRDEDFEAEVRAMLTRRAEDVSPSPADLRTDGDSADLSATANVRLDARPARRVLAAAAATIVLLAGSAVYVTGRSDRAPTATTDARAAASPRLIWPLDDHVAPDVLAMPRSAAAAYLTETIDSFDPALLRGQTLVDDTAWVTYGPPQVREAVSEVELRRDGDRWVVTRATSAAVNLDWAYPDDGDLVASFTVGPTAVDGLRLRAQAIDPQGEPAGQAVADLRLADEDGVQVEVPSSSNLGGEAPDGEGGQVIVVPPPVPGFDPAVEVVIADGDTERPVAVRLDALAPDDGDPSTPDVLLGHAAVHVSRPGDGTPPIPGTGTDTPPVVDTPGAGTPPDVAPSAIVLWPSGQRGTAAEAAQAYLDARVPQRATGMRLVPGDGSEPATGGGTVTAVRWEIADGSDLSGRYSGVVHLRDDPGGWSVIGAETDQIRVFVRPFAPPGDEAGITIDWREPESYDDVEVILLDGAGRPVSDEQVISFDTEDETMLAVHDGVGPADVRTAVIRHIGGTFFSLTEVPVA